MPNLTSVGITAGVPTSGTGTASTIDALMADGGQATIGAKADAAVTNPASSGSLIALVKGLLTGIVLAAGSAIIGKVGIDQTTPGTTNGVQVNAALPAGTNTIGKVDINAGTNLIGKTASNLATDTIYNGTTALTPKFAKISASTSGNNTLVSAVVGKKIRVLAYTFMGNGAVNAKFQDGAGGTDLTGLKYLDAAGAGICAPFNPVGWFETSSNTLLNLNLSGAVAVGGELVYVEV